MTERKNKNQRVTPQTTRKVASLLGMTERQVSVALSQREFLETLSDEDSPEEDRALLRVAPNLRCRRSALEKSERRLWNTNGNVRNAAEARRALSSSLGIPDVEIDAFVTALRYCKTANDFLQLLKVIPRGRWHEGAVCDKLLTVMEHARKKGNEKLMQSLQAVVIHGPWSRAMVAQRLVQKEIDGIAEDDLRLASTSAACLVIWERNDAPSPRIRAKVLEKALSICDNTTDLKRIFHCCRRDGDYTLTREVFMKCLELCGK